MRIRSLLDQLCVDPGFCLPPDSQQEPMDRPGTDVDEFTDRVIRAEGLDPISIDCDLRRQIRKRVARVLTPGVPEWPAEHRKRRNR